MDQEKFETNERRAERLGEAVKKAAQHFKKAQGEGETETTLQARRYQELILAANELTDFACNIAAEKRKCVVENWQTAKRLRGLEDRISLAALALDGIYTGSCKE